MTVWDELADRFRDLRARPQLQHWKVITRSPLHLERIGGTGTLQDGDDDFTVGGSVRAHDAVTPLVYGDVIAVLHANEEWVAIDVLPDG